tara:strand:- start:21634 stop:22728 length:1095 start_codon:yes stop_codon:yes gene_type:complete
MTPKQQYQIDLKAPGFKNDASQAQAIDVLDDLHLYVVDSKKISSKLKRRFSKQTVQGVYLWGEVGSGKTYLMDTFYHSIPGHLKKRIHFHEFMRMVHEQLKVLQGERDPLLKVAKQFVETAKVLCFDEFTVRDIADAMLLSRLLEALFALDLILVTTSNIAIHDLYKDGLQRQNFMPTIQLLAERMQEIKVDNNIDYRLGKLDRQGVFFSPLDETSQQMMLDNFTHFAHKHAEQGTHLCINNRDFHAIRRVDNVVWFDFNELCVQPRGAADYLELAKQFPTVLLSDVTQLGDDNETKRFINLIDVFYDEQVRLIMSSAVPIENLKAGDDTRFEFKRTLSRLQEMQSREYLEKATARKAGLDLGL